MLKSHIAEDWRSLRVQIILVRNQNALQVNLARQFCLLLLTVVWATRPSLLTLEHATNLRSRSNVPGFPRHAHKFGASRRKAGPASANLDIFWLKDESLEDSANLPGKYNRGQSTNFDRTKVGGASKRSIFCTFLAELRHPSRIDSGQRHSSLAQFPEIASDLKR